MIIKTVSIEFICHFSFLSLYEKAFLGRSHQPFSFPVDYAVIAPVEFLPGSAGNQFGGIRDCLAILVIDYGPLSQCHHFDFSPGFLTSRQGGLRVSLL